MGVIAQNADLTDYFIATEGYFEQKTGALS
jgi:hypothetical protein